MAHATLDLSPALIWPCLIAIFGASACLPQADKARFDGEPDASKDMPSALDQAASDLFTEDLGPSDAAGDLGDVAPDLRDGGGQQDAAPDAEADMTPPGPRGVPVFVGVGYMGRRVISCDGGQSWQDTGSLELEGGEAVCGSTTPSRCYDETVECTFKKHGECVTMTNCDCDHHPGRSMGVTFAGDADGGAFVATFGWGPAGPLLRSEDGITWSDTMSQQGTPAGVAYGNGTTLLATGGSHRSLDEGASWEEGGQVEVTDIDGDRVGNLRTAWFVPTDGGRFVITGSSSKMVNDERVGTWGVVVSQDEGASWSNPQMPDGCGDGLHGVVGSEQVLLLVHDKGRLCRSTDGGQTFEEFHLHSDGEELYIQGTPQYDGERFWVWGRRAAYSSADGLTWTKDERDDLHLGAAAYDPTRGVFVAARGGWKNWYEKQEFYRSTDGVAWDKVPDEDFVGGHSIRQITFGWAEEGTMCPAP